MTPHVLTDLADELLSTARGTSAGRSARTLHGGRGHALRQTVLALLADHSLGEHESPGEATLQVLRGRIRLDVGDDSVELGMGDYLQIPPERHDVAALEDAVFLLSVVVGQ